MNNFERIKNMNIEEMAKWLADEIPHGDCYDCGLCDLVNGCLGGWLKYLESDISFSAFD